MSSSSHLRPPAALASLAVTRRLRVCHVMSADLWAGAEVQVATVASYLVERPDVELTAVLFNEGVLAVELRRLGVPVTVFDERRTGSIGILVALVRLLRRGRFDIVHTHRYKDTVLGAVAARLAGIPGVVRTVHGQREPMRGWDCAKFRVYEALERVALRLFAHRIVAVSWRMAEDLAASGYGPGVVVPIHNGVDLRKVQPERSREMVRRQLGLAPGAWLIGTAGRLSPVKGHADFLRAARIILQREPAARFLIVGDGPLRDELTRSARELRIEHACLFVGARRDVYDLLAAMDVFVLPSLGEGIPMALLEAMALGRPVVATAVGGVPEMVAHRATGLLVEPCNEQALAEACLELARDAGWAQALGTRARRRVEKEFSREAGGRALVDLYRALPLRPAARCEPARRSLHLVSRSDTEGGAADPQPRPRLLSRGARRLAARAACQLERRRMERVRRDPSALRAALRSARRILMVCQGNIIRSPFAARLLARELGEAAGVDVRSAGLGARPGTLPPPLALAAAAGHGIDLADHVASPVTDEAVATSDVIFVMDLSHMEALGRRFPEARAKAFVLTCLVPESPLEVRDPFDRDESAFRACYALISASTAPIARLLAQGEQ